MTPKELLVTSLIVLPGVVVFIELFRLLPLMARVRKLLEVSGRSVAVIRSSRISEHWKERSLRLYAMLTMSLSVQIAVHIAVLFAAFSVVFGLVGLVFYDSVREVMALSYRVETLVIAVVWGALYAFVRKRLATSKTVHETDYGVSSRALHHIALNYPAIKEMAFDIDCLLARSQRRAIQGMSPVFVSGLARAGTTIVLEALYSTGAFTTLTYRDMPFVTAPYLWSKLSRAYQQASTAKQERAHGDRLLVNYDSPEAFEEVFWMTFSGSTYIKDHGLEPHDVNTELLEKYKRFVGNIVSRSGTKRPLRYLAKNNNNVLRIEGIRSAFPDSRILVPFRNPLDHARSLLAQHGRFLQRHDTDPFSLRYMNWLGHFEFGANFKPFMFAPEALPQDEQEPTNLNYWLRYWGVVHEYMLQHHSSDVIFINYDALCERPKDVLGELEGRLALDEGSLIRFSGNIQAARRHTSQEEPVLSDQVKNTYRALLERSL